MKAKILVVDDDLDISVALQQRLQMLGYDSIAAKDGDEALDLIQHESPNVVLLDLELPKLSGLEILRKLGEQSSKNESSTPAKRSGYELVRPFVVVMTGVWVY